MARTDSKWETINGGTAIQTIDVAGYDILINGSSKYLNFNSLVGVSGYGIRDNAGVMEFKNSGGAWTSMGSGGVTTFIALTDVPASYVGQALKIVRVNAGETGLEFVTSSSSVAWGAITGTLSNQIDLQNALNAKQNSILGTDTRVLFFDGNNNPAGDAGFTYNKTTDIATLGGLVTTDIHTVNANSGTNISIIAGDAVSGNNDGGSLSLEAGAKHGSGVNGSSQLITPTGNVTVSDDGINSSTSGAIFFNATTDFYFSSNNGFFAHLSTSLLAADRIFTFQNLAGTIALTANKLSVFAATTSAELAGVISDETGTGVLVFANTPTLITPVLGVATATSINGLTITASTGTLTITNGKTLSVPLDASVSGTNTGDQTTVTGNAGTVTVADAGGDTTTWVLLGTDQTGSLSPRTDDTLTYNATTGALTTITFIGALTGNASTATNVVVGGITGLGTNVATALAVNVGLAGAFVTFNGALGTPSSGVATNLTGTASGLTAGAVTVPAALGSSTATTQAPSDNSTKLATTAYVDNAVLGQNFKEACKYATTAALPAIVYANGASGVGATLTAVAFGALSFDGSTPSIADRVLIKNQVSTFQNGIYTVTTVGGVATLFVLTRALDADQTNEWKTGDSVFITSGSTLSTTTWAYTGVDNPTMGTDALTFAQIAGQGSFTGGNGITITGTSIAIDTSVTVDKTTAQILTNKTLTSPVLTTPDLGTPTALVGTNITGTGASFTAGKATILATARTIGGVSFDGSANIVPQTIQSINEATDTTCFPLFISTSGTQSLQPLNNAGFIYNSNTNALTVTTFIGALTGNASTATNVAVGGITGLGTNVATALAVNVGSAGAFITFNGDAGTPSALVGTNISGTGASFTAGKATILATARTIGGVSFDGSANITVASATGGFAISGGNLTTTGSGQFGTAAGTNGQITLTGSTSGTGVIRVNVTAGAGIVFQIPSSNGSNTNVLQTDGAGVTSWVAAGTGTVTTVSVATANGFAGSVANATTTPAITITTSINSPILAGNGTAISAATTTGSGSTAVLNNTPTLLTPVFTGLPTGTGVASAATVSTLVSRDASANININNALQGYTTTATAAGTTTLLVGSTYQQFFTGTNTQTVALPVTSTLVLGQSFCISNSSTGLVTVNSSGGNTVITLARNSSAIVTCILTSGTTAASWSATALNLNMAFDITGTADIEPSLGTLNDPNYELDGNGDIMPRALMAYNFGGDMVFSTTNVWSAFSSSSVFFAGIDGTLIIDNTNFVYTTSGGLRIGPTYANITTENKLSVIGNANDYHGIFVANVNSGSLASTDIVVGSDSSGVNDYGDFGVNSSTNSNPSFSLFGANDVYLFTGPGGALNNINIATGTAGKVIKFGVGGLLTANEVGRFTSTGLTVGLAGTITGILQIAGITSGTTSLTVASAASGTLTLPSATDTLVGRATTDTLTNKRITKRTGTTTSSATPTINTDIVDFYSITALAAAITSFTTNLSGTPTEAQTLWIAITDNGTARAITWGASFEASTVALPTTTVLSIRLDVGFVWNTVTSKWRCIAVA